MLSLRLMVYLHTAFVVSAFVWWHNEVEGEKDRSFLDVVTGLLLLAVVFSWSLPAALYLAHLLRTWLA